MKRCLLYGLMIILLPGQSCKKDNQVHIHCDGLVNDVLPASDHGHVFVANAFTPNNDGINDLFRPIATDISSINIKVYNKNANLVFQTSQAGNGWNPVISQNETYYFRVEAITLANNKIGLCGEVHALSCFPPNSNGSYTFEDQLTPFGFTGITNETLSNCN